MKQSRRGFVDKIDFFTSFGFGSGHDDRSKLGIKTQGPSLLVTDLAVWKPDELSKELKVVSLHPGVTREQIQETVGWSVSFASDASITEEPSGYELETLRDLRARTAAAHSGMDA